MSKTKQKRMTAYFLLLSLFGAPAFAEGTTPDTPATPNDQGAYIYINDESTLTNFDVQTVSNWTDSVKGAVVNDSSSKTLNLNTSGSTQTYSDNSTLSNGGAIFNAGTVNIGNNSIFTNNISKASYYGGGAIYNSAGTVTIGNNAKFEQNCLQGVNVMNDGTAGGAIASWGGGSVTLGDKAIFKNNGYFDSSMTTFGGASGGAVYISGGGNDIDPQGFFEVGTGSEFIGNVTNGSGGAIYAAGSKVVIGDKTIFDKNVSYSGGAVYNYQYNSVESKVEVGNNVKFTNNTVHDNSGGGIANFFGSLDIKDGVEFVKNKAGYAGGAIRNAGSALIGKAASFVNNEAHADDYGGGAVSNSGTMTIDKGANFSGNTSAYDGGAVYNDGTSLVINGGSASKTKDDGTVVTQNTEFKNNTAQNSGGAIYNTTDLTIGSATFSGNKAIDGLGGAIYNEGNLELDTALGNITFSDNKAGNNTNDIYVAQGAKLTLSGGGKVYVNSGIVTAGTSDPALYSLVPGTPSDLDITEDTELILGSASDIEGNVTFSGNSTLTNNSNTKISGTISEAASSTGAIVNGTNATLEIAGTSTGVDLTNNGTATISGGFTGADIVNNKNLTISGSAATTNLTNLGSTTVTGSLGGTLEQEDKNATLTIKSGASLTASGQEIKGGKVVFESGSALTAGSTLSVTDAVNLQVLGSSVIDDTGLAVGSGHIISTAGMNLTGDYTVAGGVLGSSVIITDGSVNNDAVPADDITIGAGKTLTLSNNATSNKGYVDNGTSTIKLAPTKGNKLVLTDANKIVGNGTVTVDEIVETKSHYDAATDSYVADTPVKKGVGTVEISSDNSGFTGKFTQVMGTVIQKAGKFFAGDNVIESGSLTISKGASLNSATLEVKNGSVTVEKGADISTTGAADFKGGTLTLKNGAAVNSSTINVTSDTAAGTYATVNIYNNLNSNPSATELTDDDGNPIFNAAILATDIANGNNAVLKYANADGTEETISITNGAGLGLYNGTMIDGDITLKSSTGVRDLTLGDNAGIYADNITLDDNTKLTYKDNAYIRSESNVSLGSNSQLTFANNKTDVLYDSIISSTDNSSVINKTGAGETVITSSLKNYTGSINVTGGVFDLDNTDSITVNNITIKNADMHSSSEDMYATGNVNVSNSNSFETDGNLTVSGNTTISNSQVHTSGDFASKNITLTNSDTKVDGDLTATNKLAITGGSLDAQNDVFADVSAIKNAVINVNGDYKSTTSTNIDNTNFNVLGYSDLGNTKITGNGSVINLTQGALFNNLTFEGNGLLTSPANLTVNNALVLGNTTGTDNPTINLTSGAINTITANTVTLNSDTNISIDADPRSKAIDSIKANTVVANNGAQMVITGMQFTETPIDRNVDIDITKLLDGAGSAPNMVRMASGSVIANTEMGKYLLSASSTGSSNIVRASLLEINPQMFRGQAATIATYANQLVVNNLLLDHTNILANDLIARDKKANRYAAANPLFAPYQYSKKDGDIWYKAYVNFERLTMTRGLHLKNNSYGSVIGADFPAIEAGKGWTIIPTAYIAYNGGHQHFSGVSMFQDGAQVGAMGTAYKGNLITSLLAYGGGYHNHMTVNNVLGSGSDDTGNWFAGAASKTAYNIHLPADFILQPTALVSYNIFGNQNYHSDFGNMSMNSGFLNGINIAPGANLIWNKKTFSLYGTAQLVFNILGDVSGRAGNVDLDDVRMKSTYFEYGLGAMKRFKDTFSAYLQFTIRNGYRTGIGFQGGLQWKIGKLAKKENKN